MTGALPAAEIEQAAVPADPSKAETKHVECDAGSFPTAHGGKIPIGTKILLGLGHGVEGIQVVITGYFLNKFWLETCCLEPMLVGTIQIVAGLFDVFNDPLIGFLSDSTRSRWGRRRPWLFFGGPCVAISYFCLWTVLPVETAPELKFLYYLVSYMVQSVGLTSISVQIAALVPELTNDYNERTSATAFRTVGGNILGMVYAVVHGLVTGDGSRPSAFMLSGLITGASMLIFAWSAFFGIRERFQPPPQAKNVNPFAEICLALKNEAFRYATLIYLCGPTAVTLGQSNFAMFCKYVLRDEGFLVILLPLVQGTALLAVPFWVAVSNRTSKRHTYFIGGSVLALSFFCGTFSSSIASTVPVCVVIGIALPVPFMVPLSMMPDVIEDDEERTGRRREGIFAGLFSTALKLSLTIAALTNNLLLEAAGYEAPQSTCGSPDDKKLSPGLDEQPEAVLYVIRALVGAAPAFFVVLAIFFAWRFPITPEAHAQRVKRIQAKLYGPGLSKDEQAEEQADGMSAPEGVTVDLDFKPGNAEQEGKGIAASPRSELPSK